MNILNKSFYLLARKLLIVSTYGSLQILFEVFMIHQQTITNPKLHHQAIIITSLIVESSL